MDTPRISASSYSNTAPLIWAFLYGSMRASAELILDTAPARSAELLAQDRVDAALVPVIACQLIEGVRLVRGICVGAREKVLSVCLVTRGCDLEDVRSLALDSSSRTSAALTKVIFREYIGREPLWLDAEPDLQAMLAWADAALLIGDPALKAALVRDDSLRVFDLAELWRSFTGLGFVFAMWMTRRGRVSVDLAKARDEGLCHLAEISQNYAEGLGVEAEKIERYLAKNITYHVEAEMEAGMNLFFDLAARHGVIDQRRPVEYVDEQATS
jgi:chorismate dehydratase